MIKIGLAGCGFMGGTHLSAYEQLLSRGDFQVTAIADLEQSKSQKFAKKFNAKVYDSAKELIQNADINTVDICLPTYMHYEYACMALEKGCNVFVEKPLCRTAAEAKKLVKLAAEKNAVAMVGQCLRFWDEYTYLKNLIDNNTYGKVITASFKRLSSRPTWNWQNWVTTYEKGGGAALDLHIHDTDYMLYVFGEPRKVKCVTNKQGEKHSYIMTICDYGDFTVCSEGGWDFPKDYPFEMAYRVRFEKAVVEYSSLYGIKVYTDTEVIQPEIKKENTSKSEGLGGNISDLGGYYNELVYFLDCIKQNKNAERATLNDGYNAVKFVEKELKSKL